MCSDIRGVGPLVCFNSVSELHPHAKYSLTQKCVCREMQKQKQALGNICTSNTVASRLYQEAEHHRSQNPSRGENALARAGTRKKAQPAVLLNLSDDHSVEFFCADEDC